MDLIESYILGIPRRGAEVPERSRGTPWNDMRKGVIASPPSTTLRQAQDRLRGEAISSLACDVAFENAKQYDQQEDCFPIGSQ
jgi:hypothetical protein